MAETTEISWAHATFNPWIGCTGISPGCDHCYAEAYAKRVGRDFSERTRTSEAYWRQPLKWNAAAVASGQSHRVFCASLADVFDNDVDPRWRADLFRLIHNTPALTWMLLTKRIGNAARMIGEARSDAHLLTSGSTPWPWPNVWIGATVVNQDEADRDVPKLLATPAHVRFLSLEPLLGELDLSPWLFQFQPCAHCPCPDPDISRVGFEECCREPEMRASPIDWVILGGESGGRARALHPAWARFVRDQCAAAGVAFHFKQWGGVRPKANGHLLDGAEHRAFPA